MSPADHAADAIAASAGAGDGTPREAAGSDTSPAHPEPLVAGNLDRPSVPEAHVAPKRSRRDLPRRPCDPEWRARNPPPPGLRLLPDWIDSMEQRMERGRFSELVGLWDQLSKVDQSRLVDLLARIIPVVGRTESNRGAPNPES